MDLDKFAKRCYVCACKRGKVDCTIDSRAEMHEESIRSLGSEFEEFSRASESERSDHLSGYTEAEEELADLVIGGLTELYRRNVKVETILHQKASFNENREKTKTA